MYDFLTWKVMAFWGAPVLLAPVAVIIFSNHDLIWRSRRLILAFGLYGAWRHVRFASQYHTLWGVQWPRQHQALVWHVNQAAVHQRYFLIGTVILFIWAVSASTSLTLTPRLHWNGWWA